MKREVSATRGYPFIHEPPAIAFDGGQGVLYFGNEYSGELPRVSNDLQRGDAQTLTSRTAMSTASIVLVSRQGRATAPEQDDSHRRNELKRRTC